MLELLKQMLSENLSRTFDAGNLLIDVRKLRQLSSEVPIFKEVLRRLDISNGGAFYCGFICALNFIMDEEQRVLLKQEKDGIINELALKEKEEK